MDPFNPQPADDVPCCEDVCAEIQECLSPRDLDVLTSAAALIDTATGEVNAALQMLAADVDVELGEAETAVILSTAESTGAIDLSLTEAETAVGKVIDKLYAEINRSCESYLNEMQDVGLRIPFSVGQMSDLLTGSEIDMLMFVVPAVEQWLHQQAGVPPEPTPTETGYVPPIPGPVPFPVPFPQPYPVPTLTPPPAPEPQLEPTRGPDVTINYGDTNYYAPPATPTPPTSFPTPPRPTPRPTPAGVCPPVNVNVTVPPIQVQYPVSVPTGVPGRDGRDGRDGETQFIAAPTPTPADDGRRISPPRPTPAIPRSPLPTDPALDEGFFVRDWLKRSKLEPSGAKTPDINWNDPTLCGRIEARIGELQRQAEGQPDAVKRKKLADEVAAYREKAQRSMIEGFFGEFADELNKVGPAVDRLVGGSITDSIFGSELARQAIDLAGASGVRNLNQSLVYAGRVGLANLAEQKTGVPLSYFYVADNYTMQYLNPQFLPPQAQVDNAFISNQISTGTWQCWTQALGNLPEPAKAVMLAQQVRPGIQELTQLYYRGLIDADEYRLRMREQGILDAKYTNEWMELYKQLPTQTDLLRYMVRDANDQTVVDQYRYDEGFEQKYGGQIRKWAEAQGIPPEVFLYTWRSHWELPSNTALYSMFQRLRPDRPAVKEYDGFRPVALTPEQLAAKGPRPVVVTKDDVKRAMQVNDIAPGWVDALLEVSYTPINRTDAIRAYQIGAFDEERLYEAFRDVGYSPEDARTLVKFNVQNSAIRRANTTGTWTARKIVRYYKSGAITRAEAQSYLKPITPNQDAALVVLDAADQEMIADQRLREVKALKRGFMFGEYDVQEAGRLLEGYGQTRDQSAMTLAAWITDRDGRYKQPTVSQLTQWMTQGLISANECDRRLRNLGYKKADAEKIVELAVMKGEAKGGMSAEEAGGVYQEAIKNAREARQRSETELEKRKRGIVSELIRIMLEINKRRDAEGKPHAEPLYIDPDR
jgi:polyhydroxyalkanoate synthesis regulator phasin